MHACVRARALWESSFGIESMFAFNLFIINGPWLAIVITMTGTVEAWIWSQSFGSLRIGPFQERIECGELQYSRRERGGGQGARRR